MTGAADHSGHAALSFRHPESGEWAHDVRCGPWREALEVFVKPAAAVRPAAGAELALLEVGFGRGVNTAAALRHLHRRGFTGAVRALGFEPHPERRAPWPVAPESWRPWVPWWGAPPGAWRCCARGRWRGEVRAERAAAGLARCEGGAAGFDWLFLDLFSPGRHPEDWEASLYALLYEKAAPGAVLTTYTSARVVREGLEAAGWRVERLRTRAGRDTLRACKRATARTSHNGEPASAAGRPCQ